VGGTVIATPLPAGDLYADFERSLLGEVNDPPPRRAWGPAEHALFDLESPCQMADERETFTWSSIMTSVADPYLADGELIAGLLHGVSDRYYFNCSCHCMSCGALHAILREPLSTPAEGLLTAEDFVDLFDDDGPSPP
jgi:hypothetical protein